MTGIALAPADLPDDLVAKLGPRTHTRAGRPELQFHWWQTPTVLPVRWEGRAQILRWGCKDRRSRLPYGGWIDKDHVAHIRNAYPEEVVVPAQFGLQNGVWYLIHEGIRAVVILAEPGRPVVYMLAEPASNYWRNMTSQSPMMPVFVNQVI